MARGPPSEGTSLLRANNDGLSKLCLKTSVRAGYCDVPYSRSFPISRWLGPRPEAIEALAQAHAQLGEVDGPGRPLEIGRLLMPMCSALSRSSRRLPVILTT